MRYSEIVVIIIIIYLLLFIDYFSDAEESHEIRGRRVVGVGFGNIFGGGPIQLRQPAVDKKPAAAPEANHQRPAPEPVKPSMVSSVETDFLIHSYMRKHRYRC